MPIPSQTQACIANTATIPILCRTLPIATHSPSVPGQCLPAPKDSVIEVGFALAAPFLTSLLSFFFYSYSLLWFNLRCFRFVVSPQSSHMHHILYSRHQSRFSVRDARIYWAVVARWDRRRQVFYRPGPADCLVIFYCVSLMMKHTLPQITESKFRSFNMKIDSRTDTIRVRRIDIFVLICWNTTIEQPVQHPALQNELWWLRSSPQHGASVPYLFVQFKSLAVIPMPWQMAAEKNGTFYNRLVDDTRHLAAHIEGPKRPSRSLLRPVPVGVSVPRFWSSLCSGECPAIWSLLPPSTSSPGTETPAVLLTCLTSHPIIACSWYWLVEWSLFWICIPSLQLRANNKNCVNKISYL